MKVIAATVFFSAEARVTWDELALRTDYSFEDFAEEHGKRYASEEDAAHRRVVFEENLAWIREHNSDPQRAYTVGLNKFADWTSDEFKAWVRKAPPTRDVASQAPVLDLLGPKEETLDWREKGVVSEVRDQGLCGSCWAFSASSTLESRAALATGRLEQLSPQELVSCAPNDQHCGGTGGCEGSTQSLAFEYTQGSCLSLEEDYPYEDETGICRAAARKPAVCHDGYVKLPENNYTALFAAVQEGPVAISVAAGERQFMLYESGILDSKSCGYEVDHAVQLVGYNYESVFLGKNADYWIVRNSWGTGWGEDGFIRIRRYGEGKEPCGESIHPEDGDACEGDHDPRTYCGICGVLSASTYPTGVHLASSSDILA